jgi:hypothetical protein
MEAKMVTPHDTRAAERVTLDRSQLCELLFIAAQLRSRLAFHVGGRPTRVDRALLDDAAATLVNTKAAIDLSRAR